MSQEGDHSSTPTEPHRVKESFWSEETFKVMQQRGAGGDAEQTARQEQLQTQSRSFPSSRSPEHGLALLLLLALSQTRQDTSH